ncbi:MAG: HEAT repeat domain-containing protein [Treponema sp.]|jgi:HEAT repeat protein/ribosomal protein L20A (L18A)|nr:HEAT repeat domain-containing protein [Treponema sp.]
MSRYRIGSSWLIILLFISFSVHAQDVEPSRLAIIKYGTETEIAALIQSLRTENADYLDNELVALSGDTHNQKILSGVFAFFGDREKSGLEERAIRTIEERDDEANETVLSAVDYLGKVKSAKAVPVLRELLDTQERRFLNLAFRALGRASSADKELADQTADFLVDYYTNRDPGDDNRRDIIIALGSTSSALGVSLLSEIASNTDERAPLRIAALDALSKVGDKDGLDSILACISTNDPNVRSAAVAALGPFSGEAVDKAILDAFRDSYYRTRIAAAQASRSRRLEAAVPYLKLRAERDDVPNVKEEAIRALGEIANDEAVGILDSLFTERKNSDRIRLNSAEMLMKTSGEKTLGRLIAELDEAKLKNQTALYNGFLKVIGEAKIQGDTSEMENITRRFLQNGGIIEKLYGLDMAANNNLKSLSVEIKALSNDKNESLARKARRTAERLGIEI